MKSGHNSAGFLDTSELRAAVNRGRSECVCCLWSVMVHIAWQLWLSCKPPTCRRFTVERNFAVLWKESWNVLPQIWKLHLNPSLWQSDEVLSVCLGPLVLLLLFFHWHHLPSPPCALSPLTSFSSTPDQREKEREVRLQELRQQREERSQKGRVGAGAGEVVMRKVEKSADGSTLSQVTKTDRFAQSGTLFFFLKLVFEYWNQQQTTSSSPLSHRRAWKEKHAKWWTEWKHNYFIVCVSRWWKQINT